MRRNFWHKGIPDGRFSQTPSHPWLPFVKKSFFYLAVFTATARAEVAPVAVRVPETKAWIGQRLPFFVELRAGGSFAGTAGFDLPQLPGTLLLKLGAPVVGSQELEGKSWFVQTHEFALFSQRPGILEVPAFKVGFASREGFSGPAKDVQAEVPGWKVEIRRPPGSDNIGFLITTEVLTVTETWEPQPGPAQIGAMFKRSIVQRAEQLSGMALAPAPTAAPDGIRVYPGEAQTQNQLERGDFIGERRETITYLMQKPGTLELPALTYRWWNPKTETLQAKILPSVRFNVASASAKKADGTGPAARHVWPWLLAAGLIIGLAVSQSRHLARWGKQCWKMLHPSERVAARNLLRACRQNDAVAAETAWLAWRNTQNAAFQPGPELRSAIHGLQRRLFGSEPAVPWRGDELAQAFGAHRVAAKSRSIQESASALPLLNPQR